jgi:hypothetical protein
MYIAGVHCFPRTREIEYANNGICWPIVQGVFVTGSDNFEACFATYDFVLPDFANRNPNPYLKSYRVKANPGVLGVPIREPIHISNLPSMDFLMLPVV